MKALENPFTPSFGEVPAYMPGREAFINAFVRALDRKTRSPELTTLVSGARGTGKTALLAKAAEEASAHGWICAAVTCVPGMLRDILIQATRSASEFAEGGPSKHLTALGIGQVVNVAWERASEPPSNWRSQMDDLIAVVSEQDRGILITVDEVQAEIDEMIQLAAVYQHFVSERKRVALLMAGLPFNVESLREDKSVSFVRRAQIERIGGIPAYEVRDALEKTVVQAGRSIDAAALDYAVAAIEGFPFMMQLVGYRMWEANPQQQPISLKDAQTGAALARAELTDRILESTYRELSDGDLAFLKAMLQDEKDSSIADIARRMGKSSAYANTYRRRLLKQGVIAERGRKTVGLELPMFRDFLLEKLS